MKPKTLRKSRLAGAVAVEGSRARRSQANSIKLHGSVKKIAVWIRRHSVDCERLRHSPRFGRIFTSLLDYFHHAKERRKLKMGVQVLHVL